MKYAEFGSAMISGRWRRICQVSESTQRRKAELFAAAAIFFFFNPLLHPFLFHMTHERGLRETFQFRKISRFCFCLPPSSLLVLLRPFLYDGGGKIMRKFGQARRQTSQANERLSLQCPPHPICSAIYLGKRSVKTNSLLQSVHKAGPLSPAPRRDGGDTTHTSH